MKHAYSVFEYLYRDAGNYKSYGEILLIGEADAGDIKRLLSTLECGVFFVAEQVDIPPLYAGLWAYSGGPCASDHAFHEFVALRSATPAEITEYKIWGTAQDLLSFFGGVNGCWRCELSVHA